VIQFESADAYPAVRGGLDKTVMAAGNSLMTHELERGDMHSLFSAAYQEPRRFFGCFKVAEIAETLEVSEATILRDWRAAKAWLAHPLRQ
jgi:hypothetical protein